ncbi:zinc finger CCCH domain-containing protein 13-like [Neodiprion virginianus]|uniref:zinc finger CCCH domain-containing protein 13-like n=1 Tax=Neodiprion virginianus TaxID=2961670 RepID=UPI001EE6E299|nr:zinc finger CCCH domain-containing protein 13-like [Neodiprion virginianus]
MSKPNIRKITVDPSKCNTDSRRPSVFERLGTKPPATSTGQNNSDYCRNWALNGSCSYGKSCKYAITHTLISPSKRVKKDNALTNATVPSEDPFKRVTSKIVKKTSHSPDLNLEEWNQTDLEYEDEKALERRLQLLQRELELQMKKDKEIHGKEKTTKHKKKAMSSSSSSHSSSTSSSSSSSSSDDSSSSSTSDSRKKVKKVKSKRHHSASSDYDEDKERKKKLKLKRLGTKNEKLIVKKKRKIEVLNKKEPVVKAAKKVAISSSRKHSSTKVKSPTMSAHASSSKVKERNRSESPKPRSREVEKDKHHKKIREDEPSLKDIVKNKATDKSKESDKNKSRIVEDRVKTDDKSKQRVKDKERRSRTPPIEKSKYQYPKDFSNTKSRRSRTPEKPLRSKREVTPLRHQESKTSSGRSREIDKKERDSYKGDRNKDKDDIRKNDPSKSKPSSSQEDSHRKNAVRDIEEKNYVSERNRQRSKERRDKEHNLRDDRSHSRLGRDQRDSQREKEREEVQERCRDRQRERDREKDAVKVRERDIPPLMATTAINPMDKNGRYGRDKDRFKDGGLDKSGQRDRRSERDRERSEKPLDRDRALQRFDARYDRSLDKEMLPHKGVERDRQERFPRERSLDRVVDKNIAAGARDHVMERENLYDRDRHRRFNPRFDRGHPADHERKEPPHIPSKIDRLPERRDGSRRSLEIERNYDRGYARLPPEHWEEPEEPPRVDYRDHHPHEDERRKPMEPRRYNSPFEERRGRDERPSRYAMQSERPFEDPHLPIFSGEKMRSSVNRDESSNDNWDVHHEMEHGSRDRNYQTSDWEEREWRAARPPMWDRESPPHSEVHEEEWAPRYDSPMPDWKLNEGRKWESLPHNPPHNPPHIRGPYRNDRIKEIDLGELHSKRRLPYSTPELRDECSAHGSKQGSLHGSMKEEPINKKLMELAEGRVRRSREKSVENFQKRIPQREKSEVKESPLAAEPKRPCLDESLQTLHTESDLSDISDDPDDILNMEEEESETPKLPLPKKGTEINERDVLVPTPEASQLSPKEIVEETIFTKEKDTNEQMEFRNIEEENIENMDFEEISDGELEEDIKTSGKGLGDALGVDWESLVKESQPRRVLTMNQNTAQSRWQCKAIFQRIGISMKYAGAEMVESITKKYCIDDADKFLLNDVALLHSAIMRQQFMTRTSRTSLISENLLCRNYAEANEDDDEETLQPCTSLCEEAKILLQKVT